MKIVFLPPISTVQPCSYEIAVLVYYIYSCSTAVLNLVQLYYSCTYHSCTKFSTVLAPDLLRAQ